jgi:hypothetical protein
MLDLVIHRCRVRVVRRAGWSWGPEPRELVNDIIRKLPEFLTARFATEARDSDIEVTEPMRVTILVKLDDSGKLDYSDLRPVHIPSAERPSSLPVAPSHRPAYLRSAVRACETPMIRQRPGRAVAPESTRDGQALVRLLQSWQTQGCLGILLRRLDEKTRTDWDTALSGSDFAGHAESPGVDSSVYAAVTDVLAKLGHCTQERTLRCLYRLIVATEAAAVLDCEPNDAKIWRTIARVLPLPLVMAESIIDSFSPPAATGATLTPESPPLPVNNLAMSPPSTAPAAPPARRVSALRPDFAPPTITPHQPLTWETQVSCSLPFLILGPLADIGFFAALAATLEVEELEDAWLGIAAALAFKVLDTPDRHGRRHATVQRDGAAFAGCREPLSEIAITGAAQRTTGMLSAARAVIAHALVESHPSGEPLLVHRLAHQTGWLLVKPAGAFPVAWADNGVALLPWLLQAESDLVLLPRAASDPELTRALNDAGIRFVTDAPPTHAETWRDLRTGHVRWWTNDAHTSVAALVKRAREMVDADEMAATIWRTLGTDRPTAILASGADLDHTLTLAASLALGRIAETLWSERETTDPVLTLTRFASLSARVQFQEDKMRVTLPMGRRTWDLAKHRLLDDVANLPWLGGRTVVFHQG